MLKPYKITEFAPMGVAEPVAVYETAKFASQSELSVQAEKELFFAGSKKSMSKHLERYL